jgi:membrane associated rhomboid family serine protease
MFRWIIDDTRALVADIRALSRRLSTRWQWFRLRSRQRIDAAAADLENVRRTAEVRTRMCSACRALIPVEARVCPECGERPGRAVSRGMTRVVENMLPGFVSVSAVLLTLNIAGYALSLFVWSQLQGELPSDARGSAWGITLISLGANVPALVLAGEVWRLLTPVFLHGGALHLLMNSWALLAVGPLVEELYGPRKFLFFYVVAGIGGSLGSLFWRMGERFLIPGIGASGAIFGLIGVAAVWGWRRGGALGEGIKGQMVQWALYGLVMGFMFRADNAAHVGGLATGALLALLADDRQPRGAWGEAAWSAAAWLSALAVVGAFALVGLRYGPTVDILIGSVMRGGS